MTSITYAMKAKKLLNSRGVYCEIQRTPKNVASGCGYSIKVKDLSLALSLLEENSIPHKPLD
ncbi:DUF3343 domain-containing protein [Ruminococcus sp. FC2018]|uniref:DUF3343 domain-containing protein n=1 Tax=Ruminococcus sp. FC2018 TaxID=1410617 RepID=UPI000560C73F|nr:DUF3343 domain-containing protein [Ruminococcus sp. FC2018]